MQIKRHARGTPRTKEQTMQDTKTSTSSQEQLDQYAHLWDVRNEKERETLKLVAIQYGLDPLTREVMILNGQVYVTAAGLQKLALRDPEYDGCEVDIIEARWDKDFFLVKARVWKKACSHPFEDYGDADPTTSKLKGHALFRHAVTRARARAMRSAFAVPFCAVEELDDEQRIQWLVQQRSHTNDQEPLHATEKQRNAVIGLSKQIGWTRVALGAELDRRFGTSHLDDLTRSQASQMIQELGERAKEPHASTVSVVSQETADVAPHDSTEVSASRQIASDVAQTDHEPQHSNESGKLSDSRTDHHTISEEKSTRPEEKSPKEAPVLQTQPEQVDVAASLKPEQADAAASLKPETNAARVASDASDQKEPKIQKAKPQRETEREPHGRKVGHPTTPEPIETEQSVAIANPEEAAKKILHGILRTSSLDALRQQWNQFRAISDQFPKELVERITQAKEQRKAALS